MEEHKITKKYYDMGVLMKMTVAIVFVLFNYGFLSAQKIQEVCGEYAYAQKEFESLDQAKRTAVEKAKIQALVDKFGTIVAQNNYTTIKESNVSFLSLGQSEVKGEWISDSKAPEFTFSVDPKTGMLMIRVSVCGKAREIVSGGVQVSALLLRNGLDKKFENYSFNAGDDYFLWFNSPVKGYLAVYLMDESESAFRLLPYSGSYKGAYEVDANKNYVFFSDKSKQPGEKDVDEYIFTAEKNVEHNRLYVIFSPNQFYKPIDDVSSKEAEGVQLPRELNFAEFQKWLVRNRTNDKEMKVIVKEVEISQQ